MTLARNLLPLFECLINVVVLTENKDIQNILKNTAFLIKELPRVSERKGLLMAQASDSRPAESTVSS